MLCGGAPTFHLLAAALDHGAEHVLLAGEMRVEGRFRDAGFPRDVVDRRAAVSVTQKQGAGGGHDGVDAKGRCPGGSFLDVHGVVYHKQIVWTRQTKSSRLV